MAVLRDIILFARFYLDGAYHIKRYGGPDQMRRSLHPNTKIDNHSHVELRVKVENQELDLIIPSPDKVPLKMRLIPAGSFMIGSPEADPESNNDEKPQHKVTITEPFFMGIFPVTQAQWEAVMKSNPSDCRDSKENPVENMGWVECLGFILKLNRMGIGTFRLPTEAEWEYACRAGSTTKYHWGDDESRLGLHAWYFTNSANSSHPVGLKEPNEWGLYDMYGNVWEWCSDWYGEYARDAQVDPKGPAKGDCRVIRGGGWGSGARSLRSANRYNNTSSNADGFVGFRLVRTL